MGSRKLVRDLFLSRQTVFYHQLSRQAVGARSHLIPANGIMGTRRFSIFNEFSNKLKGEAQSDPDFQKKVKEFKEQADVLKEKKDDLKARLADPSKEALI